MSSLATAGICAAFTVGGAPAAYGLSRLRPAVWARGVWDWWEVYAVRMWLRDQWRDLPGPWPVKLAILLACQFIPGQVDELAVIALARAWRRVRARRAAREAWSR